MARRKRDRVPEIDPETAQENELFQTIIEGIMSDWKTGGKALTEKVIQSILHRARDVIMSQPMLVKVEAPLRVCGDLHGQIHDLVTIFKAGGLPPHSRYLFLGDYVDRGKHGTEVICLLLALKSLYPEHVYILRGNHETETICRTYGFFDECKRRYHIRLFKEFCDVFNCLPIAGIVEGVALCMHGGLSPELESLSQIDAIKRPLVVKDVGLACDLLWSDPEEGTTGWRHSERGVSFTFGADIVKRVCQRLNVDLILRAHQVVDNGYSFFAERRLVTVFSASNYCGEFTNNGAMMFMDENCKCSFEVFKPTFS